MRGGHRKDIDGLRAVAILPVLFYHADVWPFRAGYVGVDVFFVISGYLITGLILREREAGGFSLAGFYDRRIRRILPALFAMLAAATVAALFILLPDELEAFGKSLSGAVLFYANVLYLVRDAAYFGSDAAQNPLLHVWSLSVEEQFYILWPLLLILLAGRGRALAWTIAIAAAASLTAAVALSRSDPNITFYLLPTRAWELLIGAFLATAVLAPPRTAALRNAIAIGGTALVAAGVVMAAGRPVFHSIAAVFGTAAILFASDGGDNRMSRVLATPVPVFIGRISYSLYLWHWPFLVFVRLYLDRAPTTAEALGALAAASVVSILSWRFVEQPIRRRRGAARSIRVAAASGALFLGVAFVLVHGRGLPARVPADVRVVNAESAAALPGRWCDPARRPCLGGDLQAADEAVLWGDSHARALAPGIEAFAAAHRLRLRTFTRPACVPLPGVRVVHSNGLDYGRCNIFNHAALETILRSGHVKLVILEARWDIYPTRQRHADDDATDWDREMAGLLKLLAGRGIRVLLIGNVPQFADSPAVCYGRERLFGRDPGRCLGRPAFDAIAEIAPTDTLLMRTAAAAPGTRVWLPRTALCDGRTCRAFADGRTLYADTQHLTPAGALLVGAAMSRDLRGWP